MRIDSHQHFWRYSPAEYGWMDDRMTRIRRDFLPEDLAPLLAACGLDGAVAVQARSSLEETRFLLELARAHDCVKGVVGWADLCAEDLDDVLDELCQEPLLRGLRHVVQDEPDDDFLRREDFRAGARKLAARGLVYDILIYPRQLDAAVSFRGATQGCGATTCTVQSAPRAQSSGHWRWPGVPDRQSAEVWPWLVRRKENLSLP